MSTTKPQRHIYEGSGDDLMDNVDPGGRIVLMPDAPRDQKDLDPVSRIRILWGQRLIDDLVAGRYRTLVCAVNGKDNSHGFLNLLAQGLPTSQWREPMIADYARSLARPDRVTVVKYDMDRVEVLAMLRPSGHDNLTLDDLSEGFKIVSAMLQNRADRLPSASVCFLGARANRLVDARGQEPSFETVLSAMYDAGYRGDVYPAPWMWETQTAGVFPRYPFPESLTQMREGGF